MFKGNSVWVLLSLRVVCLGVKGWACLVRWGGCRWFVGCGRLFLAAGSWVGPRALQAMVLVTAHVSRAALSVVPPADLLSRVYE